MLNHGEELTVTCNNGFSNGQSVKITTMCTEGTFIPAVPPCYGMYCLEIQYVKYKAVLKQCTLQFDRKGIGFINKLQTVIVNIVNICVSAVCAYVCLSKA